MDEIWESGSTEVPLVPVEDPGADDASFDRAEAEALYRTGFLDTHPHRWLRVKEEIRFEDIVLMLIGSSHTVISCPFHGRDSKPSFQLYRGTNDAFCFGCPPGKQYYDHVIFVSQKLGLSKLDALRWIEKRFNLPPIADVSYEEVEEEAEDEFTQITFRDLLKPYVRHAANDVAVSRDVELAREYIEILFDCWPSRAEEQADPEKSGDPLPLARVLGPKTVRYILDRKAQ